ncbi:hypothetical protein BT69DRAFT_944573 [Atractiella rhizophila]|nr:hypothetical protein BT69DRAFT_944573 [Atractiella rhizophila]
MATLNHSFTETCNRLRRHVFGSAPLRQRFDSFSSKFGRVNSPKPQDITPETAVVDVVTQPPTTTDVEPSPSCSTDVDHPSPSPSIAERPSSPPPDRSVPLSSSHPDRSVLTSVLDMGAPPTSTFPYKEMVDFLVLKASIDHVEKDDLQINLKSAREECGRLTTERQTLQSTIRELSLEVDRLRGYASRQRELEEEVLHQRKEIARLEEDHLAKSELERRLRATEMELLDRMAEFSKCQQEAEEIYLSLQGERERTVALEEKLDFLNRQQSTTTVGTIVNSEEQDTPLAVAPPPLRDHHVPVYFVKNHGTPVANQHIINVLCTLPTLSKGYTLIFCDPLLLESLFVQAFQNNPLPSLPFVIKANAGRHLISISHRCYYQFYRSRVIHSSPSRSVPRCRRHHCYLLFQ